MSFNTGTGHTKWFSSTRMAFVTVHDKRRRKNTCNCMPWKNRQINKQLKSRVIITSNRDEIQPCNSSLGQRRTYPPRFVTYDLYDRPYTGGGSVVLPGRNGGIIPRYHYSKNLSKIKWPRVRHLNMSRWSLVKAFFAHSLLVIHILKAIKHSFTDWWQSLLHTNSVNTLSIFVPSQGLK